MAIEQKTVPKGDYLDTLADFVANTSYEDLPKEVRQHAKYIWMDTIGVIMAGSLEREASALAERLTSPSGSAAILRPGFPHSDPLNAALVNGTAGVFLELDEGHTPTGHPAIYIIPPVLALAEDRGANGKQLIESLVLAYEVTARLSWSTRLVPGMHAHGSLGVIGAAVGAARLLGYDASHIRQAINIAACLNSATPFMTAFEGALVRNVYSGLSGHLGVLICHLIESGFTGPRDGLSETYNKYIGRDFNPERMVADLGKGYQITSNYFKIHAACRHTHSPLDALNRALGHRKVRPEEVEYIKVVSHMPAAACNRQDPQNPLAAKFSIPFAIATAIIRGDTGVAAFTQEAVDNPVTQDLAKRVSVLEDESFARRWPQENPARVEITLTSGERLIGEANVARGSPQAPVSYQELKEKFSSLTAPIFKRGKHKRAIDLFMQLEHFGKAEELTAALGDLAG